jgi:hypothetical protein
MRRHSAPFRFLSIFRKESARNCASADELGHGAGDGFGLLPSHCPATAGLTVRLGRRDGKAGTRKMHKDLANSGVVTLDGDLIDA